MNGPLVGFSMHPRWVFAGTPADFLKPLQDVGLEAVEFGLDINDADWPRFEPLMEECRRLGLALCFHAPYLPPYNLCGFAGQDRVQVEIDYAPTLDIAARYGPAPVVIHGANSTTRPRHDLFADTVAFLKWALERYPSLTFALENLISGPQRVKIGSNRPEVLSIVEEIDDPNLGICWDLGHDVMNDIFDLPTRGWLRHVCHAHLHDVNEQGVDHFPLMYGRVPYERWLPALVKAGFQGIISLELKGEQLAFLEPAATIDVLISSIAEIRHLLSREEEVKDDKHKS